MMTHALARIHSSRQAALHALAATGLGLVGLPLVMTNVEPSDARGWLWLLAAVLSSVWLLVSAPALIETLERFVGRLPLRSREHAQHLSHVPLDVARLLVAAAYLVVVQAVVRRPLVEVAGVGVEPFIIEAFLAGGALVALLVLLASIHRAARPLVEGVAWITLDALVATSESSASESSQVRGDERGSRGTAAPTLLAPAARRR